MICYFYTKLHNWSIFVTLVYDNMVMIVCTFYPTKTTRVLQNPKRNRPEVNCLWPSLFCWTKIETHAVLHRDKTFKRTKTKMEIRVYSFCKETKLSKKINKFNKSISQRSKCRLLVYFGRKYCRHIFLSVTVDVRTWSAVKTVKP